MRFNKALVAALALSMASTPVLAQSAAPLSIAPAARTAAATQDGSDLRGGYLIPAVVIIAVIAAAILITNHHNNDLPASA